MQHMAAGLIASSPKTSSTIGCPTWPSTQRSHQLDCTRPMDRRCQGRRSSPARPPAYRLTSQDGLTFSHNTWSSSLKKNQLGICLPLGQEVPKSQEPDPSVGATSVTSKTSPTSTPAFACEVSLFPALTMSPISSATLDAAAHFHLFAAMPARISAASASERRRILKALGS